MKTYKIRHVIGIDPSGNFNEGKGITGWCVFDREKQEVVAVGSINAKAASSQQAHWQAHIEMIKQMVMGYGAQGIVVSIEDYLLYSNQAKSQVNSTMETCQLLGVLKMYCWWKSIPLYIRSASQVKRRWADVILCHKNYIYKVGQSYFTGCKTKVLCEHERDAIRHAVHCATFELKED